MRYENVTKDSGILPEIRRLYEASFPSNEKMSWNRLIHMLSDENVLTAYYTEENILAGFTYLFMEKPAAYLSYFAVEENLRNQGYGSAILKTLAEAFPDKKIIIDIEELNDEAPNSEERKRRRSFYLRNGFEETGIFYNIWQVDYELLSLHGKAVRSDWDAVTHHIWGVFADRIIYKGERKRPWAVLATWKMAYRGTQLAADLLEKGSSCDKAILTGISDVEDNPDFHSVGYGGRPDKDGHVVLDGGYMDGDTLHFGGVAAIEGFRSPVAIAHSLLEGDANNFLAGKGAEKYAEEHHFEKRNNLTAEAEKIYEDKLEENRQEKLKAYDGHDTVCFLVLDKNGSMAAGTSTSGLFMKEPGRVGDSPMPGNGYYADSAVGAAAATGMGEEIMKGALSFAAVLYMKQGLSAQEAADKAVNDLDKELKERNGYAQPMSLIVLDKQGNYGIGTNIEFTFTFARSDQEAVIMEALPTDQGTDIHPYRQH